MGREANIVIARCMKTGKDFGIRFEKTGSDVWEATWSFKIPSNQRNKEDYKKTGSALSGTFRFPPTYPGCPHCEGRINVKCSNCHQTYCHDIEKGIRSKCPWGCGFEGELGGGVDGKITIDGKGDR